MSRILVSESMSKQSRDGWISDTSTVIGSVVVILVKVPAPSPSLPGSPFSPLSPRGMVNTRIAADDVRC